MAGIRQRNKAWYLDWREGDERKQKSLGKISKAEAIAAKSRKEYELLHRKGSVSQKQSIPFNDYVSIYLAWFERKHPASYDLDQLVLLSDIEPIFKNTLLDKLTVTDIDGLIIELSRRNKPSTINRKMGILRALLNRAKIEGYEVADLKIEEVPDLESKPPKFFTKEELEVIYEADKLYGHWWKFLANTGLRIGEFRNLRTDDIQNDSIHIISTSARRTKSKKWRLVPMNGSVKSTLELFDMNQEYLMPRFNDDMAKTRFRRICQSAGIKRGKWGVHCLRHTFASHLVMGGTPLRTVQVLMGHASMRTTEQYSHLAPDYLKGSVENLNL